MGATLAAHLREETNGLPADQRDAVLRAGEPSIVAQAEDVRVLATFPQSNIARYEQKSHDAAYSENVLRAGVGLPVSLR